MRKTLSLSRYVRALGAIVPVAFFFVPMFPAAVPRDADVASDAWWNFYTAGLPVATPTTVPEDAIAVGHNVIQPDKVAAISILLQSAPGSSVETLTLSLKEATDPGASGAEAAAVVACPITGPWDPVANGEWSAVPSYDCELGRAAGTRTPDGTWTFDLRSIGSQWLDPDFPLEQAGVLFLVEESTQPVQISFRSITTGEFRLEFATSSPTEEEPVEPVVIGGLEAAPVVTPVAPAPAPAPAEPAPAVLVTQPARSQGENISDPNILGNQPWGTWLLVPLALGAAGAVSYALGRGRDRSGTARRREGPVSRALARGQVGR